MAKKEIDETTAATEAPRVERGTSIEARTKRAFLVLLDAFNKGEEILSDTIAEFNSLADELPKGVARVGVPVEQRLSEATARRNEIYQNVEVVDGKAVWADEAIQELEDLNARIKRYKSEVDRKNKPEVSDAETDEAAE